MTKNDLIKAVADAERIPISRAAAVINTALDIIVKKVARGEKVQLPGFGTFSVRKRAAREGLNPRTGETIQLPASKRPYFTAGQSLKKALNL